MTINPKSRIKIMTKPNITTTTTAEIMTMKTQNIIIMNYLHSTMGDPVVKTFINDIQNKWITSFRGLTVNSV